MRAHVRHSESSSRVCGHLIAAQSFIACSMRTHHNSFPGMSLLKSETLKEICGAGNLDLSREELILQPCLAWEPLVQ